MAEKRKLKPEGKYKEPAHGNLFRRLQADAFRAGITPRTKESMEWFREKAGKLTSSRSWKREKLIEKEPIVKRSTHVVGTMQMFFYDPKWKGDRKVLPYYDSFPLAVIVGPAPNGFYGLNLHYLPPGLRLKFLDKLMDITESRTAPSTKFAVTYGMLKSTSKLKYFRPCFKHYLTKHVQSHFAEVQTPEWEIAAFLPTARWHWTFSQKVYYDAHAALGLK